MKNFGSGGSTGGSHLVQVNPVQLDGFHSLKIERRVISGFTLQDAGNIVQGKLTILRGQSNLLDGWAQQFFSLETGP
jgi:hypothetical protein